LHDGGPPERWLTVTAAHPPTRGRKGDTKENPRGNLSISSRWRNASSAGKDARRVGPCAPEEREFLGEERDMPGPSEVPVEGR